MQVLHCLTSAGVFIDNERKVMSPPRIDQHGNVWHVLEAVRVLVDSCPVTQIAQITSLVAMNCYSDKHALT
jgi:hypothetical protein